MSLISPLIHSGRWTYHYFKIAVFLPQLDVMVHLVDGMGTGAVPVPPGSAAIC